MNCCASLQLWEFTNFQLSELEVQKMELLSSNWVQIYLIICSLKHKMVRYFFQISNFESWQLYSPFTCKDAQWLIWEVYISSKTSHLKSKFHLHWKNPHFTQYLFSKGSISNRHSFMLLTIFVYVMRSHRIFFWLFLSLEHKLLSILAYEYLKSMKFHNAIVSRIFNGIL